MTGPEHYRAAEMLIADAQFPKRVITGWNGSQQLADEVTHNLGAGTIVLSEPMEYHDQTLALAQVHATLALAAATAFVPQLRDPAWIDVAS